MSKRMTEQERIVRIELARTRAALERQDAARSLHDLHESLTPAGLWRSFVSGTRMRRSGGRRINWAAQAMALSSRYPFLLTSASAVLTTIGRGRHGWVWRVGLGAIAGWQVIQRLQRSSTSPDRPKVHPPVP